jgi:diaminopimelate decarboxylase
MPKSVPEHGIQTVDISLLQKPKVVQFLAEQETNTFAYFPEKAYELAKEVQDLFKSFSYKIDALDAFHAIKATHQPRIVEAIFQAGFKADVASLQEAHLAMWASQGLIQPDQISYTNLWGPENDFQELVRLGVSKFVVDKPDVMEWIAKYRAQFCPDKQITVSLRPVLKAMGQGNKFGMNPDNLQAAAEYARKLGLVVDGLAFHAGTDNARMYTTPKMYRMNLPPKRDVFSEYARSIRYVARYRNPLYKAGLIGPVINTEGGLRPAYAPEEYRWQEIFESQAKAIHTSMNGSKVWRNELGRHFSPCAIAVLEVYNVDKSPRVGKGVLPYVAVSMGKYTGLHDSSWYQFLIIRLKDVLQGNIYTHQSHPEQFSEYVLVGPACAGSDTMGTGNNVTSHLLPKDLEPGEMLLMLTVGCYMSSSLLTQPLREMLGLPLDRLYGFNGLPLPVDVVYPGSIY